MIIRNIKTYDNLIELLDAFDQAGPLNLNAGNTGPVIFIIMRLFQMLTGRYIFLMKIILDSAIIKCM